MSIASHTLIDHTRPDAAARTRRDDLAAVKRPRFSAALIRGAALG